MHTADVAVTCVFRCLEGECDKQQISILVHLNIHFKRFSDSLKFMVPFLDEIEDMVQENGTVTCLLPVWLLQAV